MTAVHDDFLRAAAAPRAAAKPNFGDPIFRLLVASMAYFVLALLGAAALSMLWGGRCVPPAVDRKR